MTCNDPATRAGSVARAEDDAMASFGAWGSKGTATLLLVLAAGGAAGGCDASSTEASCAPDRTFFESEVWPFMEGTCLGCHGPGGAAVIAGARLRLEPTSMPGFVDANLASLAAVAKIELDGESELLAKPSGAVAHGGGVVLQRGSPQYRALGELVTRMKGGEAPCDEPEATPTLARVSLLDPEATFRKASLDLAGRLPTPIERVAVGQGGEAGLDAALDGLLTEEAFFDRVAEIYNDLLLTDRFLAFPGAVMFMNSELYPGMAPYHPTNMGLDIHAVPDFTAKDYDQVNLALAREPLELIRWVVKNERPWSEVVDAPYAVVNPFLARAYGVKVSFADSTDAKEFRAAEVTLGDGVALPHAGLLSTPTFLNRWPTSPTNRDRGRARRVLSTFLATDVLKLAERPVDATQVADVQDPTLNSPACTVCHDVIDPIAGGFRGYDALDYEKYDRRAAVHGWYADMAPPGFDGAAMPAADAARGLPWLGARVAGDPRFPYAAVVTVFKGLTGHDPLPYPSSQGGRVASGDLAAWSAEDAFFRKVILDFEVSGLDLKIVVKDVVESAYYRAHDVAPGADDASLADVGTARLLTPEMLSRKLRAIFGFDWTPENDLTQSLLTTDYEIAYGGIDSNAVTTRLTDPNGIVLGVQQRMANEMACRATALDFASPRIERRLFPDVEIEDAASPAALERVRDNAVHLHAFVLGEDLDRHDAEIDRTVALFVDTYRELAAAGDPALPSACQARRDYRSAHGARAADLPADRRITSDPHFTIRAWQAVILYMLSDYAFLYE